MTSEPMRRDPAAHAPMSPYRDAALDTPNPARPGESHRRTAAVLRTSRPWWGKRVERPWADRGAAAERTARQLQALTSLGWQVLHDRLIGGRGPVVDQVLIGPGGLWLLVDRVTSGSGRGWAQLIDEGETPDEVVGAEAVALKHAGADCSRLLAAHGLGHDHGWDVDPHLVNVVHTPGPARRLAGLAFVPPEHLLAYIEAHPRGLAPIATLELATALDEIATPA